MGIFPFKKSSHTIGVSITSEQIHAVELAEKRNGDLEIAHMVKLPRLFDVDGNSIDLNSQMIKRLKQALASNGFSGKQIHLSVPGSQLFSSMLELPPIQGDVPLDQIAKMEMSRIHHCEPDEFEIAAWQLPQANRGGSGTRAIASLFKHDDAHKLIDVFEAGGLSVEQIDINPHALLRACDAVGFTANAKIILHHTFDSIHLIAAMDSTIIYERRIEDLGFGQLVRQVQSKFNIEDLVTAQRLIQQVGFKDDPAIPDEDRYEQAPAARQLIHEHYQSILQELGDAQSYTIQQYQQMGDLEICLTGQASSIKGWQDIIQDALKTTTHLIVPQMICKPSAYLASTNDVLDPGFVCACGLAMKPREVQTNDVLDPGFVCACGLAMKPREVHREAG